VTRLEILQARASRGDDPKATNLYAEINRYFDNLEHETRTKIDQHCKDLTYVISQPDTLTLENTNVPSQIIRIAIEWGKTIDPSFGDDSQIVNG
jgi:hypothetical protein